MVPVNLHVFPEPTEILSQENVKIVMILAELVMIKKILIVPLVKFHFIYLDLNVLKIAQLVNMKPLTVNVVQMMIVDVVKNVTNTVKLVTVLISMIVINVLKDTSLNHLLTKNA